MSSKIIRIENTLQPITPGQAASVSRVLRAALGDSGWSVSKGSGDRPVIVSYKCPTQKATIDLAMVGTDALRRAGYAPSNWTYAAFEDWKRSRTGTKPMYDGTTPLLAFISQRWHEKRAVGTCASPLPR